MSAVVTAPPDVIGVGGLVVVVGDALLPPELQAAAMNDIAAIAAATRPQDLTEGILAPLCEVEMMDRRVPR